MTTYVNRMMCQVKLCWNKFLLYEAFVELDFVKFRSEFIFIRWNFAFLVKQIILTNQISCYFLCFC